MPLFSIPRKDTYDRGKKTDREKRFQPENTLSSGCTAPQSKWQKNPPGNKTGRISDSEKAPPEIFRNRA